MPLCIYENILWFHIPIRNALNGMEEFQYQHDLRSIEAGSIEIESFQLSQV